MLITFQHVYSSVYVIILTFSTSLRELKFDPEPLSD